MLILWAELPSRRRLKATHGGPLERPALPLPAVLRQLQGLCHVAMSRALRPRGTRLQMQALPRRFPLSVRTQNSPQRSVEYSWIRLNTAEYEQKHSIIVERSNFQIKSNMVEYCQESNMIKYSQTESNTDANTDANTDTNTFIMPPKVTQPRNVSVVRFASPASIVLPA